MKENGLTLIQLLIAIAVVIVAAVIYILVFDPLEKTRIERDNARIFDLNNLTQAINTVKENSSKESQQIFCQEGYNNNSCFGKSTDTGINSLKTNASGWVKVDLKSLIVKLPKDPINDNTYHYTYCSDGKGWEISTVLESKKFKEKLEKDGGNENNIKNSNTAKYEVGTNLNLIGPGGICTY